MRTRWLVGLLAGIVAVGCKQDAPAPPRTPASPARAPASAAPPVSTAAPLPTGPQIGELDALWALAPVGTAFGMVISPRGVALVERGWLAIQELIASSPEFANTNARLMKGLLSTLGTLAPTLAEFGLSHDKGFA